MNPSRCKDKSDAVLAGEWDNLASARHRQIAEGRDLSFEHILAPTTMSLLTDLDTSAVLDVGCGTGEFTSRLATRAGQVLGIDPSTRSIAIARATCRSARTATFLASTLQSAAHSINAGRFNPSAAVAFMSLMAVRDLRSFTESLASVLPSGAGFVATLTHPWFWPTYRGYANETWFDYSIETQVEAPFAISLETTAHVTTHVHRPLELYIDEFQRAGFSAEALVEPRPSSKIQALYPSPWEVPRFLSTTFRKK